MAKRLIPMSRFGDTAKNSRKAKVYPDRAKNYGLLMQAQEYWTAMDRFRFERERNKRYLYGDQWGDLIRFKDELMPEGKYIEKQGNTPLKNNLIRRLVRSLKGLYINQDSEPICKARDRSEQSLSEALTVLLQYNMQLNKTKDLRRTELEEFCTSGLVVERKWYGWRNDKMECWTDVVPPNNFIIDCNMTDVRGWDCGFVGQVHDVSFEQVCTDFAHSNADVNWLRSIYTMAWDKEVFSTRWKEFGYYELESYDFLVTTDHGRCRVIEIWRKENKARYRCHDWNTGEIYKIEVKDKAVLVDAENERRKKQAAMVGMPEEEVPLIDAEWFVDDFWAYYFLTPYGDVLDQGETPFEHKSHPYVFKAYPFIDGEIHSFVADVIDQQRFINRLIFMNDMAIKSSSKGYMMIPKECIPEGMSEEEFAEMSTTYNGMVFYKSKGLQHVPNVITSNSSNIGTTDLLQLQMKLMEDISGVHGALQGQTPTSGTSGTLYAQQTQNASISLVDILVSFGAFEEDCAIKELKNIQQFYDEKKVMEIVGVDIPIAVSPEKIRDVEFDISIQESKSTPVYRMIANDILLEFWKAGAIDLEQMLENGDFPFADKLLQSMRAKAEQMQAEQQMQAQQGGEEQPLGPRERKRRADLVDETARAQQEEAERPVIETAAKK